MTMKTFTRPDGTRIRWSTETPAVGSLIGVPKPVTPSYSDIKTTNTIHYPGDYTIEITAEITPGMDVLLNGVYIAGAPQYKQQVTGKTKLLSQAERARFCRGVIWWLMNDDTCLKDKLAEIGYVAPIPALDTLVEQITGSVYPGMGVLEKAMTNKNWLEIEDREYAERDLRENYNDDMYENTGYDKPILEPEYLPELSQMYDLLYPAPAPVQNVVRSWSMPHIRCTIMEVTA